ncbi:MAG: DUF4332 domain-containing protein [Planctomycetota bacterium]|nr:DUF4332 domain-containing protein [Planctomycetota bacterium]
MHIIRMDIDRKNSAEHLQVGPLACGVNAIYATAAAGSAAMSRFIKGLLFRGHWSNELNYNEESETIDGSMQWADATGHVRLMSYAGGSPLLPSRFVHSPLHPSQRALHADDRDQVRGLGNIFWEGDEHDGRWDELRGDILGMVFCSPLGTVSPEKLWWAASRLGVHSAAKSELDEGYQRLKAEEQELLDRLRSSESVDHDRAWWSLERDRIASELSHVQILNQQAAEKADRCCQPCATPGNERLVTLQVEIARLRALQQDSLVNEANLQLSEHRDSLNIQTGANRFDKGSMQDAAFEKAKSASDRNEFVAERKRLQNRIDQLLAEQATVEAEGRRTSFTPSIHTTSDVPFPAKRWDDSQLRQQQAHAEEMLGRWDRRAQSHRRLAEVQSHLRTRSPYRRTIEGSLIPVAEKYLRELTSGASRQLPPWAVEASYLNQPSMASHYGSQADDLGYRKEYYENHLPSENTRQRKLVDLAIRLSIAEVAVPRIGRIPMLLDDSLGSFRGESLEQILHVLSGFSRDGRQLLVSTTDEHMARRIAAHGGTVSRMVEVLRYARPNFVMDPQRELGMHPSMDQSAIFASDHYARPLRILNTDSPELEIRELNQQLTGLANEQANYSWWLPSGARLVNTHHETLREPSQSGRRYFLHVDHAVQEAPGVTQEMMRRLNSVGVYRVGDLLRASAGNLSSSIRVDFSMLDQIQRVAELMCGTAGLRAFDAQVLVGCGIHRSDALRSLPAADVVHRVESFLTGSTGQELLRSAASFEVARIRNWISDMRKSLSNRTSGEVVSIRSERRTVRDRANRARLNRDRRDSDSIARPRVNDAAPRENEARPRIVRSSERSSNRFPAGQFDRAQPAVAGYTELASPSVTRSRNAGSQSSGPQRTSWKFYLDIDSPIVDAPSIGPKMAERLAPFNLRTVGDLVAVNAESVASQLGDRSVSAETILQWQHQALLVCRVPNLRGHDAQMIVGSGLTSAEQVAASEPTELLDKVIRVASSKQGVRMLRGTSVPDHEEVSDWIQWAQNCRAVRAA